MILVNDNKPKVSGRSIKRILAITVVFGLLCAASSLLPINYAFMAWLVLLVVETGLLINMVGIQEHRSNYIQYKL